MNPTTSTNLAADLQTFFAESLLDINSKDQVLQTAALKQKIPSRSSKTTQFVQYGRLAVPGSPLTEAVTPNSTVVTPTPLTAVIDQWGAYVILSDVGELTVKHPAVEQITMLLGEQANELIETSINGVLVAGTSVQYANGKASRTALTNTDVVTSQEFRKALKVLRTYGVKPVKNDKGSDAVFVAFVDPAVEMDLMSDAEFKSAMQFDQKRTDLYAGSIIGRWMGIEFRRSNLIATVTSTVPVHTSYIVGRNAYAVTTLQHLSTYVESSGGTADPLHQRKTIGWKVGFKACRLNENFMIRIESGSAYN